MTPVDKAKSIYDDLQENIHLAIGELQETWDFQGWDYEIWSVEWNADSAEEVSRADSPNAIFMTGILTYMDNGYSETTDASFWVTFREDGTLNIVIDALPEDMQ